MSRMELSPDLFSQLVQARKTLDDLKSRQFAGADNLKIVTTVKIKSATLPDFSITAVQFDFDADYQVNAFARLTYKVAMGAPTGFLGGTTPAQLRLKDEANPRRSSWLLYIESAEADTYYIEATVVSTDSGVLS